MTVVTRDSIYDLDKCISQRTKAENERDKLVKENTRLKEVESDGVDFRKQIKSLQAENEALKVKLGVAVGALEKAYDSERETYWHVSEHDLGEHLKDFKLENQKMKDLKEALQTIQGENKC